MEARQQSEIRPDLSGQYIAIQRTFTTTANSSGQVMVQFVTGTANNPIVNGIVN